MKRFIVFLMRYVYAALGSVYLFTFGFFLPRNRSFIYEICKHLGLEVGHVKPLIPGLGSEEILGPDLSVRIAEPSERDGNISLLELLILNHITSLLAPRKIFEFGTFDGRTTINLALNSDHDSIVYTIDLPSKDIDDTKYRLARSEKKYVKKNASGERFSRYPSVNKIVQLFGDTATFDFGPYFGKCELVFVDASHTYDYVMHDSRLALRLLRNEGGAIIWHDYGVWDDVTRSLNDLHREGGVFAGLRHISDTSLVVLKVGQ